MKVERAIEILRTYTLNFLNEKNEVLKGLQVFAKHCEDLDGVTSFEHDKIMVGNFEELVTKMTEEEVLAVGYLGWTYDEDNNCWLHF